MDDLFFPEVFAPDSLTFTDNSTLQTAQTLGEGRHEFTGDAIDWFRIDAEAGLLEFSMTATGDRLDLNMLLHDAQGNPIQQAFNETPTESFTRTTVTAGTYYLLVRDAQFFTQEPPADLQIAYTLDIDLPQVVAPDTNNTRETARLVTEGSYDIVGTGVDWYRFDSLAGGLSVTMTAQQNLADADDPRDDTTDLNMVLSDPQGRDVAANLVPGPTETINYVVQQPGPYFLKINTAQFGDNTPENVLLSYRLTIDTPDAVVAEANDTRDGATTLTDGTSARTGTGVDWYRVDALSGPLTFEITSTGNGPDGRLLDLNMELFPADPAAASVRANITQSATERFTFTAPEDGTYFLKIYDARFPNGAPAGVNMAYNLTADLPEANAAENNDTRATADVITQGTASRSGTGVDWYRFDSLSGPIDVSMTSTGNDPDGRLLDLNVELVNSAGETVRQNFTETATESFRFVAPTNDTYFLKVYWAPFENGAPNGITMRYDLTLDTPEANVSEGNDTRATADAITQGTASYRGTGVDWYRFDALSGPIDVSMTSTGNDPEGRLLDLNVELVNSAGETVRQNFTETATESFRFIAPTDDTYFLKVYWAPFENGAPNGVTMAYDLTLDTAEANAAEANDTRAGAETITEGTISRSGTGVDWYRFDTLSGLMNFSITSTGNDPTGQLLDLNLELFTSDPAADSVGQEFTETATETFSSVANTDGTYFLKVYWAPFENGAPNGVTMAYDLTVTLPDADPAEANDTRAGADAITEGRTTARGTAVDWYTFQSGPGSMTFTLDDSNSNGPDGRVMDLNLELFDSTGESIRSNFVDEGDETFETFVTNGGTYFLKVYEAAFQEAAPNGFVLDYALEVNLPDNTWARELEFGPVRNASVTVYDIDNDGRDEIFVGTSKGIDATTLQEVRPAGLIVLEDDGTTKWTKTFRAFEGPDPVTGITYNTSSVTTAPVFSDVNGDGSIDIIVGLAADNRNDFDVPSGQPGDKGGVFAVDAQGNTLWSFDTIDSFGSPEEGPDGRPDGVYGAPRVFDIDADGTREVIFSSWDHYLYVLDGRTGELEFSVDLHDTAGAKPNVADLNGDGLFEIVIPADITNNADAGLPDQGGILHVISNYGQHNIAGWNEQVATSTDADFRGKFEEQSLWSSPKVVDLERDGSLEIVQATGNFFQDDRGQYVKVWNADGTLRHTLTTDGRTLASPLIADLDGDGSPEIIQATLKGHVHAWDAGGRQIFDTAPVIFSDDTQNGIEQELPIARQPIAVDLDGDNQLEILLTIGSQLIVLDTDGTQITSTERAERAFNTYSGSPVAHDIDGDGKLDLLSGGTTENQDRAVIYRWENIVETPADTTFRTAEYQGVQSLHEIQSFVDRFYSTILGREADAAGRNGWTDLLYTGVLSGADVAQGFIGSQEFIARDTSNEVFVNTLFSAFFNREADQGGFDGWMAALERGTSRTDVVSGFTGSREFANLSNNFGIRAEARFGAFSDDAVIVGVPEDASTLRGGAGNNTLYDEGTGVEETNPNEKSTAGQVYRLYGSTLAREPDAAGFLAWFNGLSTPQPEGGITLTQAAGGFTGSPEFSNTYGTLDNTGFVELLYRNVLGRDADVAGLNGWLAQLTPGAGADGQVGTADDTDPNMTRAEVVLGFSESQEYQNRTNASFDQFMRLIRPEWTDVLEGGAGNDQMNGGTGSDVFVFRNGQGGNDVIHGFEPWDQLQLSGFGFRAPSDAIAHMTQQGNSVVFEHSGQRIDFLFTTMEEMGRVKYNLS